MSKKGEKEGASEVGKTRTAVSKKDTIRTSGEAFILCSASNHDTDLSLTLGCHVLISKERDLTYRPITSLLVLTFFFFFIHSTTKNTYCILIYRADSVSGGTHFLVHRLYHLAVLTWQKERKSSLRSILYRH